MYTTRLRKVGGSVMLAIPPALLEMLDLKMDSQVAIAVENNQLVIEPVKPQKYSLQELLTQCDMHVPLSREEREWLDAPASGKETI